MSLSRRQFLRGAAGAVATAAASVADRSEEHTSELQ